MEWLQVAPGAVLSIFMLAALLWLWLFGRGWTPGRLPRQRPKEPAAAFAPLDGAVSRPLRPLVQLPREQAEEGGKKQQRKQARQQLLTLAGIGINLPVPRDKHTPVVTAPGVSTLSQKPKGSGWELVKRQSSHAKKKERVASYASSSSSQKQIGGAGRLVQKPRETPKACDRYDGAKPRCLAEEAITQIVYHFSFYVDIFALGVLLLVSKALYRAFERASRQAYLPLFERDREPIALGNASTDKEGIWRRQCEWFSERWHSTNFWYSRLRYEALLQRAVKRGARGFISADVNAVKVSGVLLDGMKIHHTYLHQRFPSNVKTWHVCAPQLLLHSHDFSCKVLRAMLTLSRPDELFINMDQEHRYDVMFPHVLQLGMPFASGSTRYPLPDGDVSFDNGPRDLISNGETVETAICDNRFGVRTITWKGPYVFVWGKELIALLRKDLPLALASGTPANESNAREVFKERIIASDWEISLAEKVN